MPDPRMTLEVLLEKSGASTDFLRETLTFMLQRLMEYEVTSLCGADRTDFLRGLVRRGPKGVRLVTSDAHEGLKRAIATVLGGVGWQRCRVHGQCRGGCPGLYGLSQGALAEAGLHQLSGAAEQGDQAPGECWRAWRRC